MIEKSDSLSCKRCDLLKSNNVEKLNDFIKENKCWLNSDYQAGGGSKDIQKDPQKWACFLCFGLDGY